MRRWTPGFTMMEVLTVVGIIAILASILFPGYRKTVERQYWQSAQDILQSIYSGEHVYFRSRTPSTFLDPEAGTNTWGNIYMDDPNTGNPTPVRYHVRGVTATAFNAVAERGNGACMSLAGNSTSANRAVDFSGGIGGTCTAGWPQP